MSDEYEALLERYRAIVDTVPDVELKGKTMPYTSMNGNMFSFLGKDGVLAFRLSKEDRSVFLEDHPNAIVEQYGAVMKDYVDVTDLVDGPAIEALFAEVVENARTLKPK